MKNYIVLTGFLMGLAIGAIVVGQQITMAYENAISAEVRAKLIQSKLDQVEAAKNLKNTHNTNKAL